LPGILWDSRFPAPHEIEPAPGVFARLPVKAVGQPSAENQRKIKCHSKNLKMPPPPLATKTLANKGSRLGFSRLWDASAENSCRIL
jgi:hypothetical protein